MMEILTAMAITIKNPNDNRGENEAELILLVNTSAT